MGLIKLNVWDIVLTPVYLLAIYIVSMYIQNRNIEEKPYYKNFQKGLFIKIAGGIGLVLVYIYYYDFGDTIYYYDAILHYNNLFYKSPMTWLSILSGNLSAENYSVFDINTGYPTYYRDAPSFSVVRFGSIFAFLSFKSFVVCTILLATFTYIGIWKLYSMFCRIYPQLTDRFAISILYMPSLVFWGSGVLKDSFTLMAVCWIGFSFYQILHREKVVVNLMAVVFNMYLIISIKPYIFVALLPGLMVWIFFKQLKDIENVFVRVFFLPLILVVTTVLGVYVFSRMGESLADYGSVDKILTKAAVTQQDLKQDYYRGNSFDIGEFDASFTGILSKFPIATFAGLFYPQIWHVRNIMMLIAALENGMLLAITLYLFLRFGPQKIFARIGSDPVIIFSLMFSVFFAFSVGLTTSNFGALVRYKIPAIPFYLSALFIVISLKTMDKD